MTTSPIGRSNWAKLDWQDAQREVAQLLNDHGFMIFEEKKYSNHKRTDIFVLKDTGDMITFGIIEVKCYQSVTRRLEKSAMKQGLRYLKSQFKLIENNQRWTKKRKQFFVSVVYTKDYPASFYHHKPSRYTRNIPSSLLDNYALYLLSTTPNSLVRKLEKFVPVASKQGKIDDFF